MLFVRNSLELLVVFLSFSLYYFGLGWWLTYWVIGLKKEFLNPEEYPSFVASCYLSGIISNFLLILLFQDIIIAQVLGIIVAVSGIIHFGAIIQKVNFDLRIIFLTRPQLWVLGIFIFVIYFLLIIMTPLSDWDARSIWFLHGKMIYFSRTIGLSAGWLHPSIEFSHVDYPKLIPAISAQVAMIFGFWNEYIPKMSLVFLIGPITLSNISLFHRNYGYILLLLPIFILEKWLWNGYMDGYLALYFGMGILLVYRFLDSKISLFGWLSFIYLILCLYLKNEGQLIVLCVIIVCTTIFFTKRKQLFTNMKTKGSKIFPFIISILPFILWNIYKIDWGIKNDLMIGTKDFFQRVLGRILDGSLFTILNAFDDQLSFVITIFFVIIMVNNYLVRRPDKFVAVFLFTGVLYMIGLTVIYLSTPYELSWHLMTSIDRTMLPIIVLLWVGSIELSCQFMNKSEL